MTELTTYPDFNFREQKVRIEVDANGMAWFAVPDIARILNHSTPSKMVKDADLEDDEKGMTSSHTLGGVQRIQVVSESGLYKLILKSRKIEAKAFQNWVTREVLPTIRKTGRYENNTWSKSDGGISERELGLLAARTLLEVNQKLIHANEECDKLRGEVDEYDRLLQPGEATQSLRAQELVALSNTDIEVVNLLDLKFHAENRGRLFRYKLGIHLIPQIKKVTGQKISNKKLESMGLVVGFDHPQRRHYLASDYAIRSRYSVNKPIIIDGKYTGQPRYSVKGLDCIIKRLSEEFTAIDEKFLA